jgi:hypothetical protein
MTFVGRGNDAFGNEGSLIFVEKRREMMFAGKEAGILCWEVEKRSVLRKPNPLFFRISY